MLPIAKILSSLFIILGIILSGYGIFTWDDPMYIKSLNYNVNFYWGLIVLVFGILFYAGDRLASDS
ncbi:hypothetical protein [Leptospira sp. GIMC2001]|uniref:hypothetical protein n=1 Tax=Leptospira sp. GIMC2001 TaxID=1513297 RepID=UPI00234B9065|nr:hypothetical protein [Leptospira sp. GIMC2001]WCL49433.1 hypothetical protein O4O04_19415 [Leptospira sp. GIMC2001]